ncbi:MAG: hypothetical protein WD895_00160 [Acidimicrobiia bacterium]
MHFVSNRPRTISDLANSGLSIDHDGALVIGLAQEASVIYQDSVL